jgi:hypothetical protein
MNSGSDGLRVIAVSSEARGSATAYAKRHGWRAEIWSVDGSQPGTLAYALTRRTPWTFLLDGEGRVLAEGHGARVDGISGRLVDAMPGGPDR